MDGEKHFSRLNLVLNLVCVFDAIFRTSLLLFVFGHLGELSSVVVSAGVLVALLVSYSKG